MGQLKYHNGTEWKYIDLPDQSNSALLTDVVLTGATDGANKVFTSPIPFSTIAVYRNGVRMRVGATNDFTITGPNQITFNTAPALTVPATTITADIATRSSISTDGSNSFVYHEIPAGAINGTNTSFTTEKGYIPNSLQVFRNGIRDKDITEVSPSNGTFTTDLAPTATDHWEVDYQFSYGTSGNADTVDGAHASVTPTPNAIPVLDSNAKLPLSILDSSTTKIVSSSNLVNAATGATAVSTTYNFVAGKVYLIIFHTQQSSSSDGGVWYHDLRIDGLTGATARFGGTAGTQMPASIPFVHAPTTTTTSPVVVYSIRASGSGVANIEFPKLSIVPLIA